MEMYVAKTKSSKTTTAQIGRLKIRMHAMVDATFGIVLTDRYAAFASNRSQTYYFRARTMHIAAQTSGFPSSNILQSYSKCIRRTNSMEIYSTFDDLNLVVESTSSKPMIPKENPENESHDPHSKQDWSKVQTHAWTLLLTIAIKSFIEGIAFVLTLQDSFSAGLAFLVAMIFKLFPLEPGYAIILSDAGLNHFWENLLSTLAVLPIYLGKFFFSSKCSF